MSDQDIIRFAQNEDLSAVSRLLGETWHATYDRVLGPERLNEITGRWHSVQNLLHGLDRGNGVFLVSVRGGAIVGTASAALDTMRTGVDLLRLYVHPQHQGCGLGAALFRAMLEHFPAASTMSLEVEPTNQRAIKFYERLGFVVRGKVSDCGGSGDQLPALKMVRNLSPSDSAV